MLFPIDDKPHGRLSGSRVPMYLRCPAAPAIADRAEKNGYDKFGDDDDFNTLGTAAHALAEQCLKTGTTPDKYLGETIGDIPIDAEMVEAVDYYVGYVSRLAGSPFTTETYIEAVLTSPIDDEATGIVDAALVVSDTLYIVDYKHGAGVKVEARENDQLLFYASLVLDDLAADAILVKTVVLVVIQPRYFRAVESDTVIDTWETTPEYVVEHNAKVANAIANVEAADVREMTQGLTADDTTPGDHCRWCAGKSVCPGVYKQTVVTMFGDEMPSVDFAPPAELTPAHLEYILDLEGQAKAFFKAVRAHVFAELQRGSTDYPGYKLVEKKGNRRYVNEAEALKKLGRKYGKKQVTKTVLMSPAQIEKAIGKEVKPLIESLVERPVTGQTLTKVTNPRPAIEATTAADDFDVVEGAVIDSVNDLF